MKKPVFCPRLYKGFPFTSYFLESAWELQKWSDFGRKKCAASTWTASSNKFGLEAKVKTNAFWNTSICRIYHNLVDLNNKLKSKREFQDTEICQK